MRVPEFQPGSKLPPQWGPGSREKSQNGIELLHRFDNELPEVS